MEHIWVLKLESQLLEFFLPDALDLVVLFECLLFLNLVPMFDLVKLGVEELSSGSLTPVPAAAHIRHVLSRRSFLLLGALRRC